VVKYKNGNFVMLTKNFKSFIQKLGDNYFFRNVFSMSCLVLINADVFYSKKIGECVNI
jgi:hypothetical protein